MRISHFFPFVAAALLAGCAHQGVIVQKDTTPSPFYHSYGIDGSYAFLLRDSTGATHRQIVTPEVFSLYAVGDYFNDLQPGPSGGNSDSKQMLDAKVMRTAAVPSAARVAKVAYHKPTWTIGAAKPRSKPLPVAKRTAPRKPAAKALATRPRTVTVASVTRAPRATTPTVAKPVVAASVPKSATPRIAKPKAAPKVVKMQRLAIAKAGAPPAQARVDAARVGFRHQGARRRALPLRRLRPVGWG